jgi:methyltransferase (TIGR00027 family)
MKINKTSRTAQYMALFRAIETKRKAGDRLFSDRYAIYFLDIGFRLAVYAAVIPVFRKYITKIIQQKGPGAFSSGVARTKYIDDLLQSTIIDGVKQVMILGAGFDTRASRLDFLESIPVIEVDHPNTSNFKIQVLKKHIGKLSQHITYCQADFNKQSLDELSDQYKFDFTKPTTVIWEGVTNYLTKAAIDKTFLFVSKFPKNSYIIFTYVHKQVLDDPASFLGAEKLLKDLEKLEEQWTFGFVPEELPGYLIKFGLTLIEDMGAAMYREKYLPHRSEKGYEFYRVAIAKNMYNPENYTKTVNNVR